LAFPAIPSAGCARRYASDRLAPRRRGMQRRLFLSNATGCRARFLTLLDLSNIFDWGENIAHYDEITTSLRFLFGCAVLAALLRVSSRAAARNNPLTTVPSAA